MTPIFKLEVKNQEGDVVQDITDKIAERLASIRAIDLPGSTSDFMEIVLNDPDGKVKRHDFGVRFDLFLGFAGEKLHKVGQYVFDELTFEGFPNQIRLLASSVDFLGEMKAAKSFTWEDTTLGDIVTTLAKRYGYKPSVSEAYQSIQISNINQTAESDFAFLIRLASTYAAVFKVVNGYVIFKPKADGLSVTGAQLTPVTVNLEDVTRWELTERGRPQYGAVRASYYDYDAALVKYVTVGDGKVTEELKTTYKSEYEAKTHAMTRLQDRLMAATTGSIDMAANPDVIKGLISEGLVQLDTFRSNVDWVYHIRRVEHIYRPKTGYKIKVEFSKQWDGYKK
ncbi:contractile injection system protein, VgrG/Pvc8 family [Hydrogenovibrio sp. 3SP14C1]|uniref:phage late control D family protein n=1 Tax=Hydrogenovibrio sp. 3SP14C1 TaxID=3038774 RepID=UPI0024172B90|nr:contractile injection system protein, VgrG/Pvc8 family [Hydrogenovibrio sp. 3SP14C1]MDG4811648.1 contractile injection system protein, VgrG/Pvc8 family [Hydrogenovibrio sp. 3SP14C1]